MSQETWTVKSTLDWTVDYLARKGDESPLVSAQWLLSEATGLSRIELYVNYDRPLSLEERDVLRGYVTRRGRGEPLQYITGEVGFRHITVKVRPGVLIPRPETEVLVSEALALLPAPERPRSAEFLAEMSYVLGDEAEEAGVLAAQAPDGEGASDNQDQPSLLVADVCTGSGCIACSIAYEHPATRVIATDIDSSAIELARQNVALLGLEDRIEVCQGDLGEAVPSHLVGAFDAVVSNPPYVPTSVMSEIPREVLDFEPALALDGGQDGLDLFRRLAVWALAALKPGGAFACELHETCLDEAAEFARGLGFSNVRIVYDLTGRPRVLTALK
ncbi:MAG: peptide chain release factor N(5)-glutamine methyltransferase [Eggerthellaceae bacterium]|nr:peptide chain release factor N(5)-glutamine methyltransferase [Eggerthellaceae bacterium]